MAVLFITWPESQSHGAYIAYGKSTDIKPPSPANNSVFIETDTTLMYTATGGMWALSTTFATPTDITSKVDSAITDLDIPATTDAMDTRICSLERADDPLKFLSTRRAKFRGIITSKKFLTNGGL